MDAKKLGGKSQRIDFEYFFSLCRLLGGSIGGIGTGVFTEVLLGGTAGVVLIDIDGLPVEVDRAG